jgi:transcription termination factor NusB
MYGLEKEKKAPFEFDLEIELRKDPSRAQKLLKMIEEKMQEIKNTLRAGSSSKDFDDLGILLQGYAALQKVLKRISTKK